MGFIKIDKMALADCFDPQGMAEEIHRQNPKISLPVPVEEIAKSCGILHIIENKALPPSIVGMLVSENDPETCEYSGVISYTQGLTEVRKRFTIGHELGHYLLPSHENTTTCSDADVFRKTSKKEKEANEFSSLLLLPTSTLGGLLNVSKLSLEDVIALYTQTNTGVSLQALCIGVIRLLESAQVQAAFVFHNTEWGVQFASATSKTFYKALLSKRKGDKLPSELPHLRYTHNISQAIPVPWSRWFSSAMPPKGTLFEQSFLYDDEKFRITFLITR